ncbi:unnamed protein product [Arabidopsis halleri]
MFSLSIWVMSPGSNQIDVMYLYVWVVSPLFQSLFRLCVPGSFHVLVGLVSGRVFPLPASVFHL